MKKNIITIGLCIVLLGTFSYAGKPKRSDSIERLMPKSKAAKGKKVGHPKRRTIKFPISFLMANSSLDLVPLSHKGVVNPKTGKKLNGYFKVKFKGSSVETKGKFEGEFKDGDLIDGKIKSKDGKLEKIIEGGEIVGEKSSGNPHDIRGLLDNMNLNNK